jgi:hypothetical protein
MKKIYIILILTFLSACSNTTKKQPSNQSFEALFADFLKEEEIKTERDTEKTLEEIAELEIEYEKKIAEDKSLTQEDIKDMRDYVIYLRESKSWPKTLDEAVDDIISKTKKEEILTIINTPRTSLIKYHHSWGAGIRNAYGLWQGNPKLTRSACGGDCHPDTASMKIIEAVWDKLQSIR